MAGYTPIYALLKAFLTDHGHPTIAREAPSDLTYSLPLHVIRRFGGADRTGWLDIARVDIDTFASSEDTAERIAEDIRAVIRTQLVRYIYDGSVVAAVRTMTAPTLLPWDATSVYRCGAAYELTVHRYAGVS